MGAGYINPGDFNPAAVPDYTAAALEGTQAGQQMAAASALRGIDINDPASINKGMGGLVRYGAAEQANALLGLQVTRGLYGGLSGFLQKAMNPNGAPAAQAAAPAATAPQQSATPDQTPTADPQAALHAQIANDARAYAAATPTDQATMKPQLEAKYSALGIPKDSIDSALQAISTPDGAAQFAATHDLHAQAHSGAQVDPAALQASLPAAMQPPSPGSGIDPYQWAQAYLSHPELTTYESMVKSKLGIDLGLTARAQAIMGPEFTQEAAVRNAQALSGQQEAGKAPFDLVEATLPDGSKIQIPKNLALQLGAGGALHGMTPGALAEAQAGGTAAGAAPYKVEQAPTGVPGQTSQYRLLPNPSGGPPVPTPLGGGAAGAAFGTSAGTAAEHNAAAQADALSTQAATSGVNMRQYPVTIAGGQELVNLANTVGTAAYTGALRDAAKYLPGNAQKYAANAGLLAADLSSTFKNAIQGVPASALRTNIEAKTITGAMPNIKSPQDQVRWYAMANLAATQYQQDYDRFIVNYTANQSNPRDLSQANAAWAAGPGNKSLFSEPAWSMAPLGGQPAEIPFTNRAGQPRIAVGAGLFKQPIIVRP